MEERKRKHELRNNTQKCYVRTLYAFYDSCVCFSLNFVAKYMTKKHENFEVLPYFLQKLNSLPEKFGMKNF